MIEVQGLSKSYGDFTALQNASFSIQPGEGITALLGPNGAGKSTTMRMIAGFLEPDAGDATINGASIVNQRTPLYPEMLVSEYLEFMGSVRGMGVDELEDSARDLIGKLELGSHLYSPIGILSKGFRQRVALAATLIHRPEVIILDEPTSGLDPNQIAHIRQLIRSLGQDATLILSTHILQEVEDICDRVIIMNRGRVVADQSTDSLRSAGEVQIVARGAGDLADALGKAESVRSARGGQAAAGHPEGFQTFACELAENRAPEELFAFVARQGWEVREFAPLSRSLEEIFAELTRSNEAG